jgi:hypothetical protein
MEVLLDLSNDSEIVLKDSGNFLRLVALTRNGNGSSNRMPPGFCAESLCFAMATPEDILYSAKGERFNRKDQQRTAKQE